MSVDHLPVPAHVWTPQAVIGGLVEPYGLRVTGNLEAALNPALGFDYYLWGGCAGMRTRRPLPPARSGFPRSWALTVFGARFPSCSAAPWCWIPDGYDVDT